MKTTPVPRTGASSKNENDPSAHALESGCSKNHNHMAATFLVSRPGHDAATPTWMRQGRLVSAEALPVIVGFLSPRVMDHMT